jgi:hypothetical protein
MLKAIYLRILKNILITNFICSGVTIAVYFITGKRSRRVKHLTTRQLLTIATANQQLPNKYNHNENDSNH